MYVRSIWIFVQFLGLMCLIWYINCCHRTRVWVTYISLPATFFEKFELVTSVILNSLGSTCENSKSTYYTTLKLKIFNIQNDLPFTLIEILLRFLLSVKIVSAEVALASFSNLFSSSALFSINFFGDNLHVACNFRGSKVTADWDCKDPTDAWDL